MTKRQTLIRGARIVDGTGAPWYRGDVLIEGGRIAAIGHGLTAAPTAVIIDADDRYLAPGFIDAHCHDDLMFLRQPDRPEKARQGVTSIVVGNCSFSLYPATDASRENLRRHFSGLLGETRPDEIFLDFAAYRRRLQGMGIALNLISLVGHAALRLAVMGHEQRPPTASELEAMCSLLSAQLQQGAAGLSLGLVYPPSAFAGAEELLALGRTVRAHGRLVAAHVRSYEADLIPAIDEFCDVLRDAGVAGLLSHLQSAGRPNWGQVPKAIDRLEQYRAEGVDVSFDMYPYPAGSTLLGQLLPASIFDGGLAAAKARLIDPATRSELRGWIEHGGSAYPGQSKVSLIGWNNVRLSAIGVPALKAFEGLSMEQASERLGTDAFDLMVRLIDEDDGQTGVILFQLDEADLRAACCNRLHMVGSDGLPRPGTRPHPRAFGTFPRVAGSLRRDKQWFSVEDAVRRMTSMAAQRFGLQDRGLLRPGMAADLVLFDDDIADHADFDNPTSPPSGVSHVLVNGGIVIADGEPTGQRPGRVL